jgi:tetratricopeptide (TPR) repeat protein
MARRAGPPGHPDVATALSHLAGLYYAKGEFQEALPRYEEALEMRRTALPPRHPDTCSSLEDLARLYEAKGEYEKALPLYQEALETRRTALPPGNPDTATSLPTLAGVSEAKGQRHRPPPLPPPSHSDTAKSNAVLKRLLEMAKEWTDSDEEEENEEGQAISWRGLLATHPTSQSLRSPVRAVAEAHSIIST